MSTLYSKIDFPSAKVVVSAAASVAATVMVVRGFAKDFLPTELRQYFRTQIHYYLTKFSNDITIVIEEFDGLKKNHLFYAAELYVGSIFSPNIKRYRAVLPEKEKKIHFSLGGSEEIDDKFRGIHLRWRLVTEKASRRSVRFPDEYGSTTTAEVRSFQLSFHKKHKNKVMDEYLAYVLERSEDLKEEKKTIKLHTLKTERVHGPMVNPWQSVNLDHPAKFETLAMDDEMKNMIVNDLDRFLKRRELYRKVGKAWKRGYLLFGPPGTGKSSLIAAMSNYLNFDVYDLELTDIRSNSELRRLVISTANRSILVVEDIDASIDLSERKNKEAAKPPPTRHMYPYMQQAPKVTLSGLLNFIDGLWSSCGDERIIIFTTNHKEKLDPALLRPGRMDVHIHMSYCTPCGFKLLASNYLGVAEHPLALKAEELIASSRVTPAEVGEQLLKSDDPELALEGLINFLKLKKEEAKSEHGMLKIKKIKSCDGLKELMKVAQELPAEKCEEMLKKDEAANAVRFLVGFLQKETGSGNASGSVSGLGLGSPVATLPESGKENGVKV